MKTASLKYTWLTYRRDQLWFPLAFFVFFVGISVFLGRPMARFTLARAYLGFILPLIGGVMAAYSVLDDPALELRFATPVRAGQTLLARLGLILAVQALCAFGFQLLMLVLRVDLSPLGGVLGVQLLWFLPTLSLVALACAGSLASAQTAVGASLAGAVWLMQLLTRGWFEMNAEYAFLFLNVFSPHHPDLLLNRCSLALIALILLFFCWVLLHRPERFL